MSSSAAVSPHANGWRVTGSKSSWVEGREGGTRCGGGGGAGSKLVPSGMYTFVTRSCRKEIAVNEYWATVFFQRAKLFLYAAECFRHPYHNVESLLFLSVLKLVTFTLSYNISLRALSICI